MVHGVPGVPPGRSGGVSVLRGGDLPGAREIRSACFRGGAWRPGGMGENPEGGCGFHRGGERALVRAL